MILTDCDDPRHLVIYGSLRFPAVQDALLGHLWSHPVPAIVSDWALRMWPELPYPVAVPAGGEEIKGWLVSVAPFDWPFLDAFEEVPVRYRRRRVTARPLSGAPVEAVMYCAPNHGPTRRWPGDEAYLPLDRLVEEARAVRAAVMAEKTAGAANRPS